MKKHLLLLLLSLVAVALFAQEDVVTVYGKFRLDYDLKQSMVDDDDPQTFGGFNIDRARLGFTWDVSSDVDAKVEMDIHNYALRIAEVKWSAMDSLTLSFGRLYEAFAPNSEWHATRFDGFGVNYDAGIAEVILQVGNKKDASPTALALMPALIVTPEMGDISLEAGVNGRFRTPFKDNKNWESAVNVYTEVKASGLEGLVSTDINDIQDSDAMNLNLNAEVAYEVGSVTPGAALYLEDLASNVKDLETDLKIFLGVDLADGLSMEPALALKNLAEANDGEMNYAVTVRMAWSPKYSF